MRGDSTIIKGAFGVVPIPVAVDADGNVVTVADSTAIDVADARSSTVTGLLGEILVQLRIQNQYLLKIVGDADEVLESDAEVMR